MKEDTGETEKDRPFAIGGVGPGGRGAGDSNAAAMALGFLRLWRRSLYICRKGFNTLMPLKRSATS